jgi:hypothetical protein
VIQLEKNFKISNINKKWFITNFVKFQLLYLKILKCQKIIYHKLCKISTSVFKKVIAKLVKISTTVFYKLTSKSFIVDIIMICHLQKCSQSFKFDMYYVDIHNVMYIIYVISLYDLLLNLRDVS